MHPRRNVDLASVGHGLRIAPSSIPGAGLGLYVTRNYKRGDFITWYEGAALTRREALERRSAGTDSHIIRGSTSTFHGSYIDGIHASDLRDGQGGGSACNDGAHSLNQETAYFVFADMPDGVFVRASRDLTAGDEVLVGYGRDYWHHH